LSTEQKLIEMGVDPEIIEGLDHKDRVRLIRNMRKEARKEEDLQNAKAAEEAELELTKDVSYMTLVEEETIRGLREVQDSVNGELRAVEESMIEEERRMVQESMTEEEHRVVQESMLEAERRVVQESMFEAELRAAVEASKSDAAARTASTTSRSMSTSTVPSSHRGPSSHTLPSTPPTSYPQSLRSTPSILSRTSLQQDPLTASTVSNEIRYYSTPPVAGEGTLRSTPLHGALNTMSRAQLGKAQDLPEIVQNFYAPVTIVVNGQSSQDSPFLSTAPAAGRIVGSGSSTQDVETHSSFTQSSCIEEKTQSKPSPMSGKPCPRCTYENPITHVCCEMCELDFPSQWEGIVHSDNHSTAEITTTSSRVEMQETEGPQTRTSNPVEVPTKSSNTINRIPASQHAAVSYPDMLTISSNSRVSYPDMMSVTFSERSAPQPPPKVALNDDAPNLQSHTPSHTPQPNVVQPNPVTIEGRSMNSRTAYVEDDNWDNQSVTVHPPTSPPPYEMVRSDPILDLAGVPTNRRGIQGMSDRFMRDIGRMDRDSQHLLPYERNNGRPNGQPQ
jgi:hypothetical protein